MTLGMFTKKVLVSWDYPEENILSLDDTLYFHPVTWCRTIAKLEGYDVALDHLRIYLHKRIDQRFRVKYLNCSMCNKLIFDVDYIVEGGGDEVIYYHKQCYSHGIK